MTKLGEGLTEERFGRLEEALSILNVGAEHARLNMDGDDDGLVAVEKGRDLLDQVMIELRDERADAEFPDLTEPPCSESHREGAIMN